VPKAASATVRSYEEGYSRGWSGGDRPNLFVCLTKGSSWDPNLSDPFPPWRDLRAGTIRTRCNTLTPGTTSTWGAVRFGWTGLFRPTVGSTHQKAATAARGLEPLSPGASPAAPDAARRGMAQTEAGAGRERPGEAQRRASPLGLTLRRRGFDGSQQRREGIQGRLEGRGPLGSLQPAIPCGTRLASSSPTVCPPPTSRNSSATRVSS